MTLAYPTGIGGMPVSVAELELRPSELENRPENRSLHHHHWSARRMGRLLITQTLRDLEFEQTFMMNDQHNSGQFALHTLYNEPKPASLIQMMDRLEIARATDERMRIRADGRWILQRISNVHWLQIEQEYNRETD